MGTDRTRRLTPAELALKLATADAVKAAGGQEFIAGETGRVQSRISDYCSPNTTDFMPLDVAARVEALSVGQPGAPHITRALARAGGAGLIVTGTSEAGAGEDLTLLLADVAGESSDLIRALASGRGVPGRAAARIADLTLPQKLAACRELDQLIDLLSGIAGQLRRSIEFERGPKAARADSS